MALRRRGRRRGCEYAGFLALVGLTAVAEEVTYRGAVFMLVAALVGSWWLAALLCAAAFGVAHLGQGPRAAALAALLGLRDHVVVGLTGTLFVAMGVHVLHDVITAGVVAARHGPAEDAAAAAVTPHVGAP